MSSYWIYDIISTLKREKIQNTNWLNIFHTRFGNIAAKRASMENVELKKNRWWNEVQFDFEIIYITKNGVIVFVIFT